MLNVKSVRVRTGRRHQTKRRSRHLVRDRGGQVVTTRVVHLPGLVKLVRLVVKVSHLQLVVVVVVVATTTTAFAVCVTNERSTMPPSFEQHQPQRHNHSCFNRKISRPHALAQPILAVLLGGGICWYPQFISYLVPIVLLLMIHYVALELFLNSR